MNIPKTSLPRVVIIGAGFAGINFAKNIDRKKYQVVMIDRNNYHCFQPLLYQVATAGLEPDSIASSVRTIFKCHKGFFFRIEEVEKLNCSKKVIEFKDKDCLEYDYLVLGIGSKPNFFGNKHIEKLAMPMKNIVEALNIRSLILQNFENALLTNDLLERERLMNFVIVGGGPTGVELAGALAELKNYVLPNDYPDLDIERMNIHLIDSGDRMLKTMSANASEKSGKYLADQGVNLWFNTRVLDYDGSQVKTNKGMLRAHTLIWAAGVKGNVIRGFPEESFAGGRFSVDEYNRVKGVDGVFALGDCAVMITEKKPKGDPMLAQTAIQQGVHLAKNLNAEASKKKMKPFRYNDKGSMATIGRNKAVADLNKLKLSGFPAWVLWTFVHLISLVGYRNKIMAFMNWTTQYFSYNKNVRLIIRPFKRPDLTPEEIEEIESMMKE